MKGQLSQADLLRRKRAKWAWALIIGQGKARGKRSRGYIRRKIAAYTRQIEKLEAKK